MKTFDDDIQSQTIEWLRFALAVLVVALHTSMEAGLALTGGVSQVCRIVICELGSIAVPAFFLVSGYFFFSGMQEWSWSKYKSKVLKRCKTILLPYLLWCIIALIFGFCWAWLHDGTLCLGDFWTSKGGLGAFWNGSTCESSSNIFGYRIYEGKPIDGPLWYIRDLFVICLLAPLWHKYIKVTTDAINFVKH